jgi:hybrid cluster-associated redox disulfide protein
LLRRNDSLSRRRDPRIVSPAQVLNALLSDVLAENPATAGVFVGRGMGCVGCPFARFETVADAAATYQLNPDEFARALAEALRGGRRVCR